MKKVMALTLFAFISGIAFASGSTVVKNDPVKPAAVKVAVAKPSETSCWKLLTSDMAPADEYSGNAADSFGLVRVACDPAVFGQKK